MFFFSNLFQKYYVFTCTDNYQKGPQQSRGAPREDQRYGDGEV
jgi:hypothetical protein